MSKKIQKLRNRAFVAQGGLCWYCGCTMRNDGLHSPLMCTAEHLIARSDGGRTTAVNIVAACRYCNAGRHRQETVLAPEHFKQFVMGRLRKGKWRGEQRRPKAKPATQSAPIGLNPS
ncbi:HNH endonuclease [Rhizobium sp. NPDC090275]|uniref:HNH endonuclease n=1 Tax=Rhizobium sp. NPDC090275 TaxID=3364498 RepID=UPI000DE0EB8B